MGLFYSAIVCSLIIKGAILKSVNQNASDGQTLYNETVMLITMFDKKELARHADERLMGKSLNASYTVTPTTDEEINLNSTVSLTPTLSTEAITATETILIDSNSSFRLNLSTNEENNINMTISLTPIIDNTEESNVTKIILTSPTIVDSNSSFGLYSAVNEENNINTTNALTTTLNRENITTTESILIDSNFRLNFMLNPENYINNNRKTTTALIQTLNNTEESNATEIMLTSPTIEEPFSSTTITTTEEIVSETFIWTKTTTQRPVNDTELISSDLYDDENTDETVITNYDDLKPCWQFNNKSGVCIETRICMKRQPMQTRFNACEWPVGRDTPITVCCDLYDSEDTDTDDDYDNIYWRDANVNCGVSRMSATAHNSQNLNLTDRYNVSRNKQQNSSDHSFNRFLRIINGKNAELGKIPWIVGLYHVLDGFIGGGFIISRRHFITAAHCIDNDSYWLKYYIRVGTINTYSGKRYRVTRCVLHTQYDKDIKISNDIAICRLHTDIQFTPNVSPICLPLRRMIGRNLVGQSVHVSGYGTTNTDESEVLNESQLKVVSNRQCYQSYSAIRFIRQYVTQGFRDTFMCAGDGGRDACDGDSGGPLTYFFNGRWHVVGIVAFGWQCGRPQYPGVYTCIAPYLRWIKKYLH